MRNSWRCPTAAPNRPRTAARRSPRFFAPARRRRHRNSPARHQRLRPVCAAPSGLATRGIPILLVAGDFDRPPLARRNRGRRCGARQALSPGDALRRNPAPRPALRGPSRAQPRDARAAARPARAIRGPARPLAHQAPDAEQRAHAPRHDQPADRAAAPQLPGMPPAAALHAQPHRRRDRAELGAVGLLRM